MARATKAALCAARGKAAAQAKVDALTKQVERLEGSKAAVAASSVIASHQCWRAATATEASEAAQGGHSVHRLHVHASRITLNP